MEIGKAQFENNLLGFLVHQLIDINLHLFDDFFDPCWVNPPIMHQPFKRHFGDFTPQWIEP